MPTSATPAVIDALYTAAVTALPTVKVYDGPAVSDDPGDFLMVGVDDPDGTDAVAAADAQQTWANANHTARDEVGDITCVAVSWNGNGKQKQARDGVYATAAALEGLLRSDPTLGVPSVLWTGFGTSQSLSQNQDEQGAVALLVFRITYRARL